MLYNSSKQQNNTRYVKKLKINRIIAKLVKNASNWRKKGKKHIKTAYKTGKIANKYDFCEKKAVFSTENTAKFDTNLNIDRLIFAKNFF